MTQIPGENSVADGPEGSIFLFRPLTEAEYGRERFALLLGRGAYRDLDPDDAEGEERGLQLRLRLTRQIGDRAIQ